MTPHSCGKSWNDPGDCPACQESPMPSGAALRSAYEAMDRIERGLCPHCGEPKTPESEDGLCDECREG